MEEFINRFIKEINVMPLVYAKEGGVIFLEEVLKDFVLFMKQNKNEMQLLTLIDYGLTRIKDYGVSRNRFFELIKATNDELKNLDKVKNPVTAESVDYAYTSGCDTVHERLLMNELAEKAKKAARLC